MKLETFWILYENYKNENITIQKQICIENIDKLLKKCINLSQAQNTNIRLYRLSTLKTYNLTEIKKWHTRLKGGKNEELD